MAASTSATIFLVGIFPGVGAKLGPFSRMERSVEDSGFFETLTTQFPLLIVGGWFASVSLLRLLNLLLCLASIVERTELLLCFRKWFRGLLTKELGCVSFFHPTSRCLEIECNILSGA